MAMSTKDTKTSQSVKLCASLQTLVCLTRKLTPEKKALMSNSVFRGLLEIENGRESSATLISSFCDIYEPATKVFVLNNHASFSFCVKEVAYAIGMENTGTSSLAISHEGKFPQFIFDLKKELNLPESKKLKTSDVKTILEQMDITDEQSKTNFKKLLSFFLIELILLCPPDPKVPRSSSWAMVDNLDALGDVNWPKVIFDNLHASFAKLKNLKDAPGKVQHFFSGFAPIFEAIVFSRIQSLAPMPDLAFIHPPIQSYKSKRIGWKLLKTIEASEITACQWCEHGVEVDTVVDDISTNAVVDDISASDAVVDDSLTNAVVDDISASGEKDCSADGASVTKEGYDKLVLDVVSLSLGDASASAVSPPKKELQPRRKSERIRRRAAKRDLAL